MEIIEALPRQRVSYGNQIIEVFYEKDGYVYGRSNVHGLGQWQKDGCVGVDDFKPLKIGDVVCADLNFVQGIYSKVQGLTKDGRIVVLGELTAKYRRPDTEEIKNVTNPA